MKRSYETTENLSQDLKEKVENELNLGFLNLEDGFFPQAETNFLVAAEFDKTCPDAFWGMMLTKLQLSNEDDLFSNPVQYKDVLKMPECQKALEFAGENLKKRYESLLERIYKINEGENY